MITSLGWTWEYIDECMTLPRLAALSAYWQNLPPAHVSVAAFIGIKPQPKLSDKKPDFVDLPEYEE